MNAQPVPEQEREQVFELHRFLRLLTRIPGFDDGRYRDSVVGRNKRMREAIAEDYTGNKNS